MSTLRVLPDPDLRAAFAALYPHVPTAKLAQAAGISLAQAYRLAASLGLKKTETYLASPHASRLHPARGGEHPGKATQFKAGHTTWNKGMKGLDIGGHATRFQKGRPACEASNYRPIGSLRISADGYLERKITDNPHCAPSRRWVGVHRLVWEAQHGPLPAGHVVVFREGCRTTDPSSITADRLELVTRAELMRRNSVHRLPPEIKEVSMLRGQIRATITKRRKKEESAHDHA